MTSLKIREVDVAVVETEPASIAFIVLLRGLAGWRRRRTAGAAPACADDTRLRTGGYGGGSVDILCVGRVALASRQCGSGSGSDNLPASAWRIAVGGASRRRGSRAGGRKPPPRRSVTTHARRAPRPSLMRRVTTSNRNPPLVPGREQYLLRSQALTAFGTEKRSRSPLCRGRAQRRPPPAPRPVPPSSTNPGAGPNKGPGRPASPIGAEPGAPPRIHTGADPAEERTSRFRAAGRERPVDAPPPGSGPT